MPDKRGLKFSAHTILFFVTVWLVTSCKTVETARTTPTQKGRPAGYTISIRIQDSGSALSEVMDRVHQFVVPIDVQFNVNKFFLMREEEIQIKIPAVPDKQINEIRNALNTAPGVIMVNVYKN